MRFIQKGVFFSVAFLPDVLDLVWGFTNGWMLDEDVLRMDFLALVLLLFFQKNGRLRAKLASELQRSFVPSISTLAAVPVFFPSQSHHCISVSRHAISSPLYLAFSTCRSEKKMNTYPTQVKMKSKPGNPIRPTQSIPHGSQTSTHPYTHIFTPSSPVQSSPVQSSQTYLPTLSHATHVNPWSPYLPADAYARKVSCRTGLDWSALDWTGLDWDAPPRFAPVSVRPTPRPAGALRCGAGAGKGSSTSRDGRGRDWKSCGGACARYGMYLW